MKRIMILSVLMCGLCAALHAATDMGVLVTSKNITDYAKAESGSGGTATITIVDTNGTANAVTVYNKSQMDSALSGKAPASDVSALQNRASALETATNNLTTAVAGCAAFDEDGKLHANGYIVHWGSGGYIECLDGSIHFYHPSVHGSAVVDQTITLPIKTGTAALTSDIPSSWPASSITNAPWLTSYTETDPNVPSWAKASSKPSYNYSEIGNKPTTLSGYGITDAKINNGTITLGSNSITPLTSYTETDPTALKPSQLTVDGTAMTTSSAAVELGAYYITTVDGKPHLMLR